MKPEINKIVLRIQVFECPHVLLPQLNFNIYTAIYSTSSIKNNL